MALSEKELERLIESDLSKELEANIEVPDINNQWQKIKKQLLIEENSPAVKTPLSKQKRIVVAATILLSVGSLNFLYPNNANALGGKIAEFFSYMVGKTTGNITQTYKQDNSGGVPNVVEVGTIIQKETTLDQAQASISFKLITPSYLPPGTSIGRVMLTGLGADVYEISIEYKLNDKVFVFSQQNTTVETSRGTLYDTDDTIVKELIVNGSPAILFRNNHGICTLNWQMRGLILQITGYVTEEEITKIGNSIK